MNTKQVRVIKIGAVVLAAAILFPPWHIELEHGRTFGLGHAFLFEPPEWADRPTWTGTVDCALLAMEIFALALVGAAWLLATVAHKEGAPLTEAQQQSRRNIMESAGFIAALVLAVIAAASGYFLGSKAPGVHGAHGLVAPAAGIETPAPSSSTSAKPNFFEKFDDRKKASSGAADHQIELRPVDFIPRFLDEARPEHPSGDAPGQSQRK